MKNAPGIEQVDKKWNKDTNGLRVWLAEIRWIGADMKRQVAYAWVTNRSINADYCRKYRASARPVERSK